MSEVTCPFCEGVPLEGVAQFGATERDKTEHEAFDEDREDVPPSLVDLARAGALTYYECDNPGCRASFIWPQPTPALTLEEGQVALDEGDMLAIKRLVDKGLLQQPGG